MRFLNIFFINFFLLLLSSHYISSQPLSENAEISVITCAPGNELYSTFGHTAIRVKDPIMRTDNVYNYGTFDFATPDFYLKFTSGKLDYMLTVSPYRYFVIEYMNENRWIKEQVLNLDQDQKNKIFQFLQNNALPENMYYRYDFFYDNCATRVKDVVKVVLGEDMLMPETITEKGTTFRDLLMIYLNGKNWERFGINLILGQPANKIVSAEESTFLPDYHEMFFDSSNVIISGELKPLVKEKRMLYNPKEKLTKGTLITPSLFLWIMLAVVLFFTFLEFKKKTYYILIDKTILFFSGLIGLIILLVWFGTEHSAVVDNWNVIWAMPLYFIVSFILKRKDNLPCVRLFLLIWAVLLFISLIADFTVYNLYDYALTPLILILLIRTPLIFFLRK